MAEQFMHERGAARFVATIDGEFAGEAHYVLSDGVAGFDHTLVSPRFGGRGVAARLVQHAMDEVRAAGEWKVRAECPYVVHWFRRHPEYHDLLA